MSTTPSRIPPPVGLDGNLAPITRLTFGVGAFGEPRFRVWPDYDGSLLLLDRGRTIGKFRPPGHLPADMGDLVDNVAEFLNEGGSLDEDEEEAAKQEAKEAERDRVLEAVGKHVEEWANILEGLNAFKVPPPRDMDEWDNRHYKTILGYAVNHLTEIKEGLRTMLVQMEAFINDGPEGLDEDEAETAETAAATGATGSVAGKDTKG